MYHHMIRMDHASRKKLPLDLEWYYTPDHGSWLNVAECELSVLEWQCLAVAVPGPAAARCRDTHTESGRLGARAQSGLRHHRLAVDDSGCTHQVILKCDSTRISA